MKVFIWDGDGISSAYHDDGTLVVLANDAQQAREIVLAEKSNYEEQMEAWNKARDDLCKKLGIELGGIGWWRTFATSPEGAKLNEQMPSYYGWDGSDQALNRDPDRVFDLDKPAVLAFNGGGYD